MINKLKTTVKFLSVIIVISAIYLYSHWSEKASSDSRYQECDSLVEYKNVLKHSIFLDMALWSVEQQAGEVDKEGVRMASYIKSELDKELYRCGAAKVYEQLLWQEIKSSQ